MRRQGPARLTKAPPPYPSGDGFRGEVSASERAAKEQRRQEEEAAKRTPEPEPEPEPEAKPAEPEPEAPVKATVYELPDDGWKPIMNLKKAPVQKEKRKSHPMVGRPGHGAARPVTAPGAGQARYVHPHLRRSPLPIALCRRWQPRPRARCTPWRRSTEPGQKQLLLATLQAGACSAPPFPRNVSFHSTVVFSTSPINVSSFSATERCPAIA